MDDLLIPANSSATEEFTQRIPNARFVKAFNTNFAYTLGGDTNTNVLIASNDDAKNTLIETFNASNIVFVDAGSLKHARELEAIGFLQITLAIREKISWMGGVSLNK